MFNELENNKQLLGIVEEVAQDYAVSSAELLKQYLSALDSNVYQDLKDLALDLEVEG